VDELGGYQTPGLCENSFNYVQLSTNHLIQPSVIAFLKSGSPSEQLHACLKKLEDELSLPNTKYLIPSSTSLSLVDIAVWATLYLLMAPENSSEVIEGMVANLLLMHARAQYCLQQCMVTTLMSAHGSRYS
jgi:hypothetical protein